MLASEQIHSKAFSMHPHLAIHVNEAIAYKDVRLTTTFYDLLMNMPAIFKQL
jgi:hypothetical protein